MSIRVLSQNLINQIAAGEVVVRMASVVKELVENSIDAGATRIELVVGNDVRDLEIRDDGCGMGRDDAELCLQRHATSKIRSADDLLNLSTRGFRGEAMPSIASVSRMEIQTRERDKQAGIRVAVEGGHIDRIESVGCPPGTRIVVRDLFYNTPARRKFLKSIVGEMNALMSIVTRQAIAQPHIGFRVERGGREILDVPTGQSLRDRFSSILGSAIKRDLLEMNLERDGVRVTGFLAHPLDSRGDRRSQFFFVNDRPFTSKPIAAALEQGCRGFVMAGRFPVLCAFISVPPGDVDFNVHPTKEEVRFRDERFIGGTTFHAAKEALEGSPAHVAEMRLAQESGDADTTAPSNVYTPPKPSFGPGPGPAIPGFFTSPEELIRRAFDRKKERSGSQADWLQERDRERPTSSPVAGGPARSGNLSPARETDGSLVSAGPGERPDPAFWDRGLDPEPLGQIANTYILARLGDELLVIDQHAAHERLVYLELKRKEKAIEAQQLLVPITLELDPAQSETLRETLPHLAAAGFDIDEFGPRTWAIHSLPADLGDFDPTALLIELIGDMEEARRVNALEDMRDKILIRAACHGSIRAGMHVPLEKQRQLLRQMKTERLSLTCPHGRPTIVRLTKTELDRQFKRIV